MRLVVDGEAFAWWFRGGVRRIYTEVLPRLATAGSGIDVTVVVPGKRTAHVETLGCRVRSVPQIPRGLRPWRVWDALSPGVNRIAWRIGRQRVRGDIFHPTFFSLPPRRMPSFCFVHDMTFELFPECFDKTLGDEIRERKRRSVERADLVLCISDVTRNDLIRLYDVPEGKCRVVPLAGFTEEVREGSGCGSLPDRPFLLYVGDWWTAYKNFPFLLRCLGSKAFRDYAHMDLVVVSSRSPNDEDRERLLSMADRLTFVRGCSDSELIDLYSHCQALVYPSLYEGFGLPVLEALGAGAPVVCSNAPALREVGGDCVYAFDPRSEPDCKRALSRALSVGRDPAAVRRRKERAATFSWDDTARHFAEAARSVAQN